MVSLHGPSLSSWTHTCKLTFSDFSVLSVRGWFAAPVRSSNGVQRQQHGRQAFSSPPQTFLFMHAYPQTPLPRQPRPTSPASKTHPGPPICGKISNAFPLTQRAGIPRSTRTVLKNQHGLAFVKKQVITFITFRRKSRVSSLKHALHF